MTWAAHQLAYWSAVAPHVLCNDSILDWCRCDRPRDHDGPCAALSCSPAEHDAIRDHDSLWRSPMTRVVGTWGVDGDALDIRNCARCGSTLVREIPRASVLG